MQRSPRNVRNVVDKACEMLLNQAMTTNAKQVTYRKTKAGEWVVCGPVSIVKPGATVTVTKRDGTTKRETIASIGKPFDGMVYGYLDKQQQQARRRSSWGSWDDCPTGGDCWSFANIHYCRHCGKGC